MRTWSLVLVVLCGGWGVMGPVFGQTPPEPSKQALISVLQAVFPLLERGEFEEAAQYFVVPPNFKPEMLDGFVEKREISAAGIAVLERDAEFGTAVERFGQERATALAGRARVPLEQCYGFLHETPSATGEVIAVWSDDRFRLIRLDDVGKLAGMQASSPDNLDPSAPPSNSGLSLAELAAAVEASPQELVLRAQYAMALHRIKNFPAAWTQLMAAYQLNPQHSGIAKGISAVWRDFEKLGLTSVDVPDETILGVLDEPRQKVELAGGERWVYAFMALDFEEGRLHETIDLRGATEDLFRPTEIVDVDLDGRSWRCGNRFKTARAATALLYPPGQSIADWTEQIELQRILKASALGTPGEIGEQLVAQVTAAVPTAQHKVLEQDDNSIILALQLPAASDADTQHQLVRLLKGPTDVHRLCYSKKGAAPSAAEQAKWLGIVRAAKLLPTKLEAK